MSVKNGIMFVAFVCLRKLYRTKVLCGSVVFVDVLFLWIGSVLCFIYGLKQFRPS